MRLEEVCDLKVQDVFLDERTLEFRSKGGDRRKVALPKDVVPLLKAWLRRRIRVKQAQDSPSSRVPAYSRGRSRQTEPQRLVRSRFCGDLRGPVGNEVGCVVI
jgi:integrase